MTDSVDSKILDWMITGRTGASSKCMAAHLTGRPNDGSYPHDGGDFGRCLRLLEAVPELRDRLPNMETAGRAWAALASAWDELEALHASSPEACGKRIREIIRPVEQSDPNVHRVSPNMTIRTGRPV